MFAKIICFKKLLNFSGKKSLRNPSAGGKDATEKPEPVEEKTVIETCPIEVEPIAPNKNSEKTENEVKNEVKTEAKTEVINEVKNEVKPEVKNEVKTEVKNELKSEIKSQIKDDKKSTAATEAGTVPTGDCVVCGKSAKALCSKCKHVFYCTRECQKKDWNSHKEICKSLANLPYRVSNFVMIYL